ncbi:hypothetical protein Y032_0743g1994 [Ancylostoma ceylanicum]|uniref:Uncharacterized protein n=1 Tax=Ancylostoma ceylanicum TaxID=53326 RepID=A0A016WEQ6_9BILA|nr:hypothetical protein Y032_0743g1994 [Ancylostoma ceylanicum]
MIKRNGLALRTVAAGQSYGDYFEETAHYAESYTACLDGLMAMRKATVRANSGWFTYIRLKGHSASRILRLLNRKRLEFPIRSCELPDTMELRFVKRQPSKPTMDIVIGHHINYNTYS